MQRVPLAPLRWQIMGEWRAQPGRALVAVLAIAVGVALGLAVQLVNGAALGSFGRAMASVTGQAELIVRGATSAGLDEALYPAIARLPGVAAASPAAAGAAPASASPCWGLTRCAPWPSPPASSACRWPAPAMRWQRTRSG
jgi:hypothetical protein